MQEGLPHFVTHIFGNARTVLLLCEACSNSKNSSPQSSNRWAARRAEKRQNRLNLGHRFAPQTTPEKATPALRSPLLPAQNRSRGELKGKRRTRMGLAMMGVIATPLTPREKNGEKEWIWAFLEGIFARKPILWQLLSHGARICVKSCVLGGFGDKKARSDGYCRQTS